MKKQTFKHIINIFLLAVLLTFGNPLNVLGTNAVAQAKVTVPVKVTAPKTTKTVDIRKTKKYYLHPGEKVTFSVGKKAVWSSSDTSAVKIGKNTGKATALDSYVKENFSGSGESKIKAKVSGKTYTCTVEVSRLFFDGPTILYKQTFEDETDKSRYEKSKGPYLCIDTELGFSESYNFVTSTKWKSSNTSVVGLTPKSDLDTIIYPKKAGTATITATTKTMAGYTYTLKQKITVPTLNEEKTKKKMIAEWKKENYVRLTEEQVQEKIEEFKLIHPLGSKWNSKTYFGNAGGCLGYAAKLSAYIFGGDTVSYSTFYNDEDGKLILSPQADCNPLGAFSATDDTFANHGTFIYNFDKLRPGDVIYLGMGKHDNINPYHVVVVTGRGTTEDYDYDLNQYVNVDVIYVAEGNSAGKVDYTSYYTKADLEDIRFTAMTRYGY